MLVARKKPGETWRQAVARIACRFGLDAECLEEYDRLAANDDDPDAAWKALAEWDCLDFEDVAVLKQS